MALVLCGSLLVAWGGGSDSRPPPDGTRPIMHPRRVAVLVLENRSFEQVIGNAGAPYINGLARRNALATRYYAVAHPSLPM